VFDLRKNGIIAVVAFIVSLLIGLLNRITLPMLIIRPLIFAILFFALSGLIVFTVRRFLSGLFASVNLTKARGETLPPGSHINITEGDDTFNPINFSAEDQPSDTEKEEVLEEAQAEYSAEGLENISGLLSTSSDTTEKAIETASAAPLGVDQNVQTEYTGEGKGIEEMPEPGQFVPWEPEKVVTGKASASPPVADKPKPTFSGDTTSADMLPDLDSMAGAFFSGSANEEDETEAYTVSVAPSTQFGQDKNHALPANFDARKAASGIRTVLNKDKEG